MFTKRTFHFSFLFITAISFLFLTAGWTATNSNPHYKKNVLQGKKEKTTDKVFKNIKVLKGLPASQLLPTMHFFEASLGFDCSNCHVRGHMDSDKKPEKRKARKMIKMMEAINKDSFGGKQVVTCFTCHRGHANPLTIPAVITSASMNEKRSEEKDAEEEIIVPNRLNTPEEIVAKYQQAIGGNNAYKKLTTLKFKGTVDNGNHRTSKISIIQKAPLYFYSSLTTPFGTMEKGYNGSIGWMKTPRGGLPLEAGDEQDIKLAADFYAPVNFLKDYSALKFSDVKLLNDDTVYVVDARYSGIRRFKFYFDAYSGLLLRKIQYDKTLLGELQTRTDYSDYRKVNGILFPFELHVADFENNMDIKFSNIAANTQVNSNIFNMPPKSN